MNRNARHAVILRILESSKITSQAQLSQLLLAQGIETTQATLSRDLDELGAKKTRDEDGPAFYTVGPTEQTVGDDPRGPEGKLRKMLDDLVVATDVSGNIVVLKTPPGAAQYLASFIDRVNMDQIAGTIAGDDTIFVLASNLLSGNGLAELLGLLPTTPKDEGRM